MSPELRSALRGLCCGHGWSYAALWRPHDREPWLLMMEDCYYEERIGSLIDKLRNQTQMVGQGTLGLASISGRHQWIYSDTFCIGSSSISPGRSLEMLERKAEWQHQFTAGIKTIAIICLPSSGLVQFGSFQKIPENLKLADQVQCVFWNLENAVNLFIHLNGYRDADAADPQAKFASTISSGIAYHDDIGAIQLTDAQSSTGLFRRSSFQSLRYHEGSELHSGTTNPLILSMPVVSGSKVTSKEIDKFIDTNSSSHLTNQLQATGLASQPLLPSNAIFLSNSSFPDNSLGNHLNSNAKNNENASQHILKHIPLSPSMFLAKSPLSTPHADTFDQFGGGSGESCSPYGIQGLTPVTKTSGSSKPSFYDTGNPFCDLPTDESFSKTPSFVLDFPDNLLASPRDLSAENSALVQSKNDPISDLVRLSDQLVEQVSDVPTAMMNNDVVGVSHSSSFLVGNAVDNDLFADMGLDLSRRVIGPDSWEEVMLSMGDGGCSSLTTSFADLRPLEDFDNDFFSDSTLDQLLDSVFGGDAHLLSSPVASLDLDHHRSPTITKKISPRLFRNQTPSASQPPLIQTADISLHEQILGNIMQGSQKEACSFVINQTKKPEESRKLTKKRARPGEGTRLRPKDRQQIQDRVKELRDIVPNGAKCSIDSLLDRTIKHMLYLQSVTKYADKLPHTDEPKIVGDESGVVLQDSSSSSGGATWAYEVAGQTMVCPILVEDLKPPGQMLVEMLCEERGFFLEIADVIRGFGLMILKGVMEIRGGKIWARFFVEANQNLTRMDIFLSLVQLLQQANYARSGGQSSNIVENGSFGFTNHRQSQAPVPISLPDGL